MKQDSYKDLRAFERFEVGENATLTDTATGTGYEIHVADVSLGGLQLRSEKPLPSETLSLIKVSLGPRNEFEFHGHVRYCNLSTQEKSFVSGFKFAPQSGQERVNIAEFVRQVFENEWQDLAS